MGYDGFQSLECYREARRLRIWISTITKSFPPSEQYLLVKQMIRSSRSVTANIAEGYGRYNFSDTRNFFIIARGSLTETLEHLITSKDESYITTSTFIEGKEIFERTFKLMNGFIAHLEKQKKLMQ